MKQLLIAAAAASAIATAAASDAPQDYTHLIPLTTSAKQGVLQLRLPKDVYLHARSPLLDDVRVFDAGGAPQPFALRTPAPSTRTSRHDLPLAVFPLMGTATSASQLDLDVSTAADGRLLSVKVRPDGSGDKSVQPPRLTGLVLDLGQDGASKPVGALRFTLPSGQREYSAQVWLETSADMKHWDTVGAAELNWLVNQDAQTLANDRLEFDARNFRYARLSWRSGTPIQFAAITAEQLVRTDVPPPGEQLLVQAAAGRQAQDLVYAVPPAIAPDQAGLQFSEPNIVLSGTLGSYRELPARQATQGPAWRFDPLVSSTFYRITQGGQMRSSGDIDVPPVHATQWVLRTMAPTTARPALRLDWQPATLVFLASGNGPYTLAVGREHALPAVRELNQVAPGFSDAELQKLEQVGAGPATQQQGSGASEASAAVEAANAARQRLIVLWGVLLLGVAVLAFMVWRLLRPSRS
ncbi:DUF3999 family protein [Duganella sp. BJB488]|uniref:DUF3999 family protein n=1 Tax=unclassified Duganella TaxID=2636909 RepID=UPI000E3579E7|nr:MULTISPECIES: DUF3999 family protein [unclassified Duganella]RFP14072.1 DUF3999 family protein [Duganella sp. BJB489]RFP17344.1 DUF3999 family protein [Duganella sp. BJB488]RFP31866.1 DUF3999 family protein [Duganella sp. BJB480]